jgi:hypothetical protein
MYPATLEFKNMAGDKTCGHFKQSRWIEGLNTFDVLVK